MVTDLKRFLVKDWRGYNFGTVHATNKQLTVYIVRIGIYLLKENSVSKKDIYYGYESVEHHTIYILAK